MIRRKKADCKECGDNRYIYARGYCQICYDRQRKKTPLHRPTKPIPKESPKRKKERPIYSKLAKKFKEDNPYCQARLEGCTHIATEVHHRKGRGIHYLDTSTFLSLCHSCHTQITEHSALAISQGFSFSRLSKN